MIINGVNDMRAALYAMREQINAQANAGEVAFGFDFAGDGENLDACVAMRANSDGTYSYFNVGTQPASEQIIEGEIVGRR